MTDIMSLTALVDALREKGFKDIKASKLQYYKDMGIIQTVSEFPQFNTYSLKEVSQRLKRVAELKKQGKTLAEIASLIVV